MGIYIPNMDMPKRCELCPCSYYSEGALSDICQVTDKPIDGKPTDCPLIEIDQEDEEAVLFLARMRKAMREGKSLREFLDGERRSE